MSKKDLLQHSVLLPEKTSSDICSVIRKKAMIANSFVAIMAAAIMLMSKSAKSYEMIIVARILHGYTAGKPYSVSKIMHVMFLLD